MHGSEDSGLNMAFGVFDTPSSIFYSRLKEQLNTPLFSCRSLLLPFQKLEPHTLRSLKEADSPSIR